AGSVLVAAAIGGGVASLGILLAGAALSGEERLIVAIAYAALALLLLLVGGAMLVGGLVAAHGAFLRRGLRSFALGLQHGEATLSAFANITPGSVTMGGTTVLRRALEDAPEPAARDVP